MNNWLGLLLCILYIFGVIGLGELLRRWRGYGADFIWAISGPPPVTPLAAVPAALAVTVATTLIEAISIWGLDNLTITAVAILILSVWPF